VLAQHQHQHQHQHKFAAKDLAKLIISLQEANKREENQARRNDSVLNLQEVTPESHQKSQKKTEKQNHHADITRRRRPETQGAGKAKPGVRCAQPSQSNGCYKDSDRRRNISTSACESQHVERTRRAPKDVETRTRFAHETARKGGAASDDFGTPVVQEDGYGITNCGTGSASGETWCPVRENRRSCNQNVSSEKDDAARGRLADQAARTNGQGNLPHSGGTEFGQQVDGFFFEAGSPIGEARGSIRWTHPQNYGSKENDSPGRRLADQTARTHGETNLH
jgi:hypothetical protein